MADEQHEWLDADAAEMLLRGEPVEPVGDHARTRARRLEAALSTLRDPATAGDELPGEAAVLAAFREASRGGKRAGAASPLAPASQQDARHTVRIGAARTATPGRPRWTRPLRYGLAVSLAGCALGGVAVAGGTGLLPAPFGKTGSPAPATSVSASASASPEELGADLPDVGEPPSPLPSVSPSGSPGRSKAPEAPEDGEAGSDGRTGQDGGSATDREDTGGDSTTGGGTQDGTGGREVPQGSRAEVYKKSVKACRAFRDDTLGEEEESRLLELADGKSNLKRFCDRLLGAEDGDAGGGDHDQGQDDDGNTVGDGGSGDGESSLPSVGFRPPTEQSTPDEGTEDGTDASTSPSPAASPVLVPG
uniref:Extensin n=1 Tax=Streptomyces sp. NBC_01401 TaxID=2903854 RepID=A0AAU3GVK5_9ACTN